MTMLHPHDPLTCGASGTSVNLSQQSPPRWVCASASKQSSKSTGHHVHALQGRLPKGPPEGPGGTCLRATGRRQG
eukprot:1195200-Prorocentrum_minimum.AAC.6